MADLHIRVREHLHTSGVSYVLRDHGAMTVPITSPADLAAALGYPLGRIMKTLVCLSRSTGTTVAIVCPMNLRVDFGRVGKQLNCGRLEVATPAALESATRYARGGVSPLGLDGEVVVVVARPALQYDTVLIGGGAPGVEVEIAPGELIRITGATLVDVSAAS